MSHVSYNSSDFLKFEPAIHPPQVVYSNHYAMGAPWHKKLPSYTAAKRVRFFDHMNIQ